MMTDLLELSNVKTNIDTSAFRYSSQEQTLFKEIKNINNIMEEELIWRSKHHKN